jgi:hypothetical protein
MELLEAFPRLISWAVPIIILAIIIFPQAIRILREYERGVIFRLGKLLGAKGPGDNFPDPNRRSDGANGFARRHHQRRAAGGDDA